MVTLKQQEAQSAVENPSMISRLPEHRKQKVLPCSSLLMSESLVPISHLHTKT